MSYLVGATKQQPTAKQLRETLWEMVAAAAHRQGVSSVISATLP